MLTKETVTQDLIVPGKQPQCQTDIEYDPIDETTTFEFLHPKTTCELTTCEHHYICKTWKSGAQKGAILPISQSVEFNPIIGYSPSDMENCETEELNQFSNLPFAEKDYIANYQVVGQGTKKPTCGTFHKGCLEPHPAIELNDKIIHQKDLSGNCEPNQGYGEITAWSCHRPLCPVCFPSWVKRSIMRAEPRFTAREKQIQEEITALQQKTKLTPTETQQLREKRNLKRCHIAVSVPQKDYDLTVKQMLKKALKILKQLGIDGGTAVYHSARQIKKIPRNWTPQNTRYEPHFHFYAHVPYAWLNGKKVDQIHARTGYVTRMIGERPIKKSLYYQLSHAGVPPKHGHVITWFGSMNYRKIHVEKYQGQGAKCPWGHKLNHYIIHPKEQDLKLNIPEKDGVRFLFDKTGWIYLPHKIKQKDIYDDEGGGEY
jgi:hypothetical protein